MKLDSKTDLKHLKVDGGMTNGDKVMEILADIGGFDVIRPEMREYVIVPSFPSSSSPFLSSCSTILWRILVAVVILITVTPLGYLGLPPWAPPSSRDPRSVFLDGILANRRHYRK